MTNSEEKEIQMEIVRERYEPPLAPTRRSFEAEPGVQRLLAADCPPDLVRLFMLRYSAHGVRMTEQVESWIHRAGDRCTELGRTELGHALRSHARSEGGHEKLMENDARLLADEWNRTRRPHIDAETILRSTPLYSTRKYVQLHEEVIAGPRPYCQVAIEYEIERLSVVLGPAIVARCAAALGGDGYSFLAEHVELDKGHTAFNERQLGLLLEQDDADLVPLVETGREALNCYLAFVAECAELAEADLARLQLA
jgi:hypothetical protein